MKQLLNIVASVDQPETLKKIIEALAQKSRPDFSREKMQSGWEEIQTSSIEVYVNGTIEFVDGRETFIAMPFTTSFLFTCMETKDKTSKLSWNLSLS